MQGSFSDIALPALLQTLCTSLGRAKLHLRQNGEEGTIYIDRGNVSDAAIGTLRGEEAFCQLFTWNHATFRTVELSEASPRTIAKPWGQLLLESAAHVDDASRSEAKRQDRSADLELEDELLDVLAACERLLQRLRTREVRQRPPKALAILQELLDELIAAAPRILEDGSAGVELLWENLSGENKASPVPCFRRRAGRVCAAAAIRLYRRWLGGTAQRSLAFQEMCRGLVTALDHYLALPSDGFGSAAVAESWQETYRLFLSELSTCLEDLEF